MLFQPSMLGLYVCFQCPGVAVSAIHAWSGAGRTGRGIGLCAQEVWPSFTEQNVSGTVVVRWGWINMKTRLGHRTDLGSCLMSEVTRSKVRVECANMATQPRFQSHDPPWPSSSRTTPGQYSLLCLPRTPISSGMVGACWPLNENKNKETEPQKNPALRQNSSSSKNHTHTEWCTQNLHQDGNSSTWHQQCNNQTIALSVHRFGGY